MVLSIFGIDQTGNNNRVKIDQDNNVVVTAPGSQMTTTRDSEVVASTEFSRAVRDGRAFSAGTPLTSIRSDQYLNVTFFNPVGSSVNCIMTDRKLRGSRVGDQLLMSYGFVPDADRLTGATFASGNNRWTGNAGSSVGIDYALETSPVMGPSGVVIEGFIPNNGTLINIDSDKDSVSRVFPPGTGFGIYISPDNQATIDRAAVIFAWFEEPI